MDVCYFFKLTSHSRTICYSRRKASYKRFVRIKESKKKVNSSKVVCTGITDTDSYEKLTREIVISRQTWCKFCVKERLLERMKVKLTHINRFDVLVGEIPWKPTNLICCFCFKFCVDINYYGLLFRKGRRVGKNLLHCISFFNSAYYFGWE